MSFVDEYLLRKIVGAPSKTPKETLYLETGCKPLKFIVKKRRLMYLHHILKRKDDELIHKFYKAQKLKPSKNDWVVTIEEDKKYLDIKMEDNDIRKLSKYKFKQILNEKIKEHSFKFLIKKKESHSKTENLIYDKLEIQSYLKSDSKLSNEQKQLLFKFRTRMIDLKTNYRNKYFDLSCQLGCGSVENQIHLFQCEVLINKCEDLANNVKVEYEDIFGDITRQIDAIKLLTKIWNIRDNILETSAQS